MKETIKNAAKTNQNYAPQNPNIPQRLAADPDYSVWVNASAGTGKTKVLTDRLIRLMLPRTDGRAGTPPHRILCLTYTKAGAGEMLNRIMEVLSKWAGLSDNELQSELEENVLGVVPNAAQITKARSLFAEVVDTPGGIKIMTIHSFCQSLLGRFPVEAALPPDFTLMSEEEGRGLIKMARDSALQTLFTTADCAEHQENHSRAQELMLMLTRLQNSDQLIKLLDMLIRRRQRITKTIAQYHGLGNLIRAIYALHDFTPEDNADGTIEKCLSAIDIQTFYNFIEWLQQSDKKTDLIKADALSYYVKNEEQLSSAEKWAAVNATFLSSDKNKPSFPTTKLRKNRPDLYEQFTNIAEKLLHFNERLNALETCRKSQAVLILAKDVIEKYEQQKTKKHWLDYDDLILKAIALVQNAPSWVMFKLDGGIDHILVDEAQDSNPDQWIIIDALIKEFFAGLGQAEESVRTLFVVGDEKQSIFGFQGSDPDVFQHYRRRFKEDFESAELNWRDQPLNTSFRSVQAVLDIVDKSFNAPYKRLALTGRADQMIEHNAYRFGQAGYIALWPLILPEKTPTPENWHIPQRENNDTPASSAALASTSTSTSATPTAPSAPAKPPQVILAHHIASTIRFWLDTEQELASTALPIRAGDIMILVRHRSSFVDHMIRALKEQNIPVSGVDRMVLSAQIIVQDLLSIARFALTPEDNLSLACALKSPLIGISEEELLEISYGRERSVSLWKALNNYAADHKTAQNIVEYLKPFIATVRHKSVFDFFNDILLSPCPQNHYTGLRSFTGRLGTDCLDAAEEFLSRCFNYDLQERKHMQHFLHSFEQSEESIKREIDEGQNVVRIMTVHGSKGLQAPIVFLPDTITTASDTNRVDRFVWVENDDGGVLPLWDNQKHASARYTKAREDLIERGKQEYERLLYVALTRAEDRLYIGGYQKSLRTKPEDHSWYFTIKNALSQNENCKEIECPLGSEESKTLVFETPQQSNIKKQKQKTLIDSGYIDEAHKLSDDFLGPPKQESHNPPRPLQPSRPSQEEETPALSPLKAAQTQNRFKRGNIIHALLQFLPELPEAERRTRAHSYLLSQLPDARETAITALLNEVFAIIENPEYAPLFCGNSKAEVPLTGTVSDDNGSVQVISGQIDRLVINNIKKQVLIIDYKTNRPAPRTAKDIPILYKKQMGAYRRLLQQIYRGYDIKTYLLWTDYTAIMEVIP